MAAGPLVGGDPGGAGFGAVTLLIRGRRIRFRRPGATDVV